MEPLLLLLAGCAAIYLGCRGFQSRGIVIWHRTGGETRITGWPGRVIGLVLILLGGAFIWAGLAFGINS